MAQTADDIVDRREGGADAPARGPLYETHAPAVLAYCARLCAPEQIAEAVEAAFEERPADVAALRRAMRFAAAGRTGVASGEQPPLRRLLDRLGEGRRPCEVVPRVLAAAAEGELSAADSKRLDAHLRRCRECRTLRETFDDGERAFEELLPDEPRLEQFEPGVEQFEPGVEQFEPGVERVEPGSDRVGGPRLELLGDAEREWREWVATISHVGEDEAADADDGARAVETAEGEVGEEGRVADAEGLDQEPRGDLATLDAEQDGVETGGAAPRGDVGTLDERRGDDAAPDEAAASTATAPPQRALRPTLPSLTPRGRRRLAAVLLVVGVLLIGEAVTTVLWKEPFTAYLATRAQAALRHELARLAGGEPGLSAAQSRRVAAIGDARTRADARMALLAGNVDARTRPGRALGWIRAPHIGMDFVFVQGTGGPSLRQGPGHYLQTDLPGEGGTVGIAGHRTTYLAPFRDIDQLRRGDRIVVQMPYGVFTYAVEGRRIVPAGQRDAFRALGYERLVLSACHPLYSASHRILVSARLVSRVPLGAALGPRAPAGRVAAARRTQLQLRALGRRVLSLGEQGSDVRELQYLLGVPTTGYFGYETESALVEFERAHRLAANGIAGPQVKQALARRPQPPLQPPTPPTPAPAAPPTAAGANTGARR